MFVLTYQDTKDLPKELLVNNLVSFIEFRPNPDLNGYIRIDAPDNFGWLANQLIESNPYLTILLGYIKSNDSKKYANDLRIKFAEFHHRGVWFKPGLRLLEFVRDQTEKITINKVQTSLANSNSQMIVSSPEARLLSTEELANYLKVSIPTIRRWIESGKIPVVRQGKVLRFYLPDVLNKIKT